MEIASSVDFGSSALREYSEPTTQESAANEQRRGAERIDVLAAAEPSGQDEEHEPAEPEEEPAEDRRRRTACASGFPAATAIQIGTDATMSAASPDGTRCLRPRDEAVAAEQQQAADDRRRLPVTPLRQRALP